MESNQETSKKRKVDDLTEPPPKTTAEILEEQGYVIIPNFLDVYHRIDLTIDFLKDIAQGNYKLGDDMVERSYCQYNFPPFLSMLHSFVDKMSSICGKELVPTYTYARFYTRGAKLDKHTDRDSCEYSVTLNLEQSNPWPLILVDEENNKEREILLNKGDALVYKGIKIPHYRNTFDGDYYVQVLLHYVDKNGSNCHFAHDGNMWDTDIERIKNYLSTIVEKTSASLRS